MTDIQKPIKRGKLRQILGKEYYIFKRRIDWIFSSKTWAKSKNNNLYNNSIFKHKSIILRPLKDVEMYLQENKKINLEIAIKDIDKIILNPRETFSIWKLIGRPTKRKGYLEGLILNQGKTDTDIGGGLCQLSNLLFWIFAHSPLTITERHRHSFDVFPDVNRKVPFGAGATLSYNYIDLQIKNETKFSYQIKLWLDKTHLNGELFCSVNNNNNKYSVEERNHIIKQEIWGGYSRHNQIIQIVEEKNGRKTEKLLVENHVIMMYSPFLEEKNKII